MSEHKLSTEPFLDSDEAAALLRIHPKTLQRHARHGRVTGYRVGKMWRFHASELKSRREAAASFLDATTAHEYALTTTRARN